MEILKGSMMMGIADNGDKIVGRIAEEAVGKYTWLISDGDYCMVDTSTLRPYNSSALNFDANKPKANTIPINKERKADSMSDSEALEVFSEA